MNLTGLLEGDLPFLGEWSHLIERAGSEELSLRGLSFKHRYLIRGMESALAAFLCPESSRCGDRTLLPLAERSAELLLLSLNGDGTCNSVNIASPPDTAFVTERAGALLILLEKRGRDIPGSSRLNDILREYLERTCEALMTGGIHTPNHRWVISSALSYGYALLAKNSYGKRAEEWLDEGIDLDGDGQFSERSTSIYSPVSVHCLLNMAENLDREDLYEPIRRHLTLNLYHFTPEGTLLTRSSRRQDAFFPGHPDGYWLPYRIMAGRDGNGEFAGAARFIEEKGFNTHNVLTDILSGRIGEDQPLPSLSLPVKEDRLLRESGLFRSWDGKRFYALFAGADRVDPFRQTSGLANHPDLLTYGTDTCLLKSLRIAYMFFSTGYFRADRMEETGEGLRLSRTLSVPYFDRLSGEHIRRNGSYALTGTGRYWSKMDFPHRKRVNEQELRSTVDVSSAGDGLEIRIRAEGSSPVPAALEFQFPREGELRGVWAERGNSLPLFASPGETLPESVKILKEGSLEYRDGESSLVLGEGRCEHDWLPCFQAGDFPPLERDMKENRIVYMTLYTPFDITLTLRSR